MYQYQDGHIHAANAPKELMRLQLASTTYIHTYIPKVSMYVLQFQPWIFFYSISSESAKWSKIVRGEVNYDKRSKLFPTWASISLPHECGGGWPALKISWLWSLTWFAVKSLTSKATPLATQFFKRSYKMNHPPQL